MPNADGSVVIDVLTGRDELSPALGKISSKASEFQRSLEASNARVLAFGASAGALFTLRSAFNKLVESTVEVESSIAQINVLLNLSGSELAKFSTNLFKAANATSSTFSDAAKAAQEFSRQGLGVEATLKRTVSALTLAKLSGLSLEASVSSLTASLNGFGKEALTDIDIVNRLANVDAKFAVSSADLAEALKRVSSSASDAGVSFNQIISLVTAAQQVTARGGAVIGNSLKTILTRVQRPQVLEDLEAVGIAIRDLSGKKLPVIAGPDQQSVLRNLAKSYDTLSSAQESFVAETVGGVYQINILKSLLGDLGNGFTIYDGAVKAAEQSTASAQKRIEALNNTIASQFIRTLNNLTSAASTVGNIVLAPTIRGGAKFLDNFTNFGRRFNPEKGEDETTLIGHGSDALGKGLGNAIAGPGVQAVVFGLTKLFQKLITFVVTALKDVSGLNDKIHAQEAYQQRIVDLLQQQNNLYDSITSKAGGLAEVVTNTVVPKLDYEKREQTAVQAVAAATIKRSKAGGHIPNLNTSDIYAEMLGAKQGGYNAGKIIGTSIANGGSSISAIVNSAETKSAVKVGGKTYEFVNPPQNSMAGRAHMMASMAKTGINPYGLGQMGFGKGFVPNLATVLGEGVFGKFYDLEKTISGKRAGVKVFKSKEYHSISDATVDREYEMSKKLEGVNVNPLFYFPQTLGRKKRAILKEVFQGKSPHQITGRMFDSRLMGVIDPFQRLLRGQLRNNGIEANDIIGHSDNSILNSKAEEIFTKIAKRPHEIREKFLNHIDLRDKLVNQIAVAISKKGGQIGIVDPGNFETRNQFSGGLIPAFSGVSNALKRENLATHGHGILSRSSKLITNDNPLGFAAIDSRSQSTADEAIRQHQMFGQPLSQIRRQKSSNGLIPNLALGDEGGQFFSSVALGMAPLFLESFGPAGQSANKLKGYFETLGVTLGKEGKTLEKEIAANEKGIQSQRAWIASIESAKNRLNKGDISTAEIEVEPGNFKRFSHTRAIESDPTLKNKLSAISDDIEKFDTNVARRKSAFRTTGFVGGIGGGLLGGAASSIASKLNAPDAAAAIDDFTVGLQTGGQLLTVFPNKFGKFLGGVSLATGAISGFDTLFKGIGTARKNFEDLSNQTQKLVSEMSSMIQIVSTLDGMYADSSVTQDSLLKTQQKYDNTLAKLETLSDQGQEVANKVRSAPDSNSKIKALSEAQEVYTTALEKQANLLAIKEQGASRSFFGTTFGAGVFGGNTEASRNASTSKLQSAAGFVVSGFSNDDEEPFNDKFFKENVGNKNFRSLLKTNEGFRSISNSISDAGGNENDQKLLIAEIRKLVISKALGSDPKVIAARNQQIEVQAAGQEKLDSEIKRQQNLRKLFVNQGSIAGSIELSKKSRESQGNFDAFEIGEARTKSKNRKSALFSNDVTNQARDSEIEGNRNKANFTKRSNDITLGVTGGILDHFTKSYEGLTGASGINAISPKANEHGETNPFLNIKTEQFANGINQGLAAALKTTDLSGGLFKGIFDRKEDFVDKIVSNTPAPDLKTATGAVDAAGIARFFEQERSFLSNHLTDEKLINSIRKGDEDMIKEMQEFLKVENISAEQLKGIYEEAKAKRGAESFDGVRAVTDPKFAAELRRKSAQAAIFSNSTNPDLQARGKALQLELERTSGNVVNPNDPRFASINAAKQRIIGRVGDFAAGLGQGGSDVAGILRKGANAPDSVNGSAQRAFKDIIEDAGQLAASLKALNTIITTNKKGATESTDIAKLVVETTKRAESFPKVLEELEKAIRESALKIGGESGTGGIRGEIAAALKRESKRVKRVEEKARLKAGIPDDREPPSQSNSGAFLAQNASKILGFGGLAALELLGKGKGGVVYSAGANVAKGTKTAFSFLRDKFNKFPGGEYDVGRGKTTLADFNSGKLNAGLASRGLPVPVNPPRLGVRIPESAAALIEEAKRLDPSRPIIRVPKDLSNSATEAVRQNNIKTRNETKLAQETAEKARVAAANNQRLVREANKKAEIAKKAANLENSQQANLEKSILNKPPTKINPVLPKGFDLSKVKAGGKNVAITAAIIGAISAAQSAFAGDKVSNNSLSDLVGGVSQEPKSSFVGDVAKSTALAVGGGAIANQFSKRVLGGKFGGPGGIKGFGAGLGIGLADDLLFSQIAAPQGQGNEYLRTATSFLPPGLNVAGRAGIRAGEAINYKFGGGRLDELTNLSESRRGKFEDTYAASTKIQANKREIEKLNSYTNFKTPEGAANRDKVVAGYQAQNELLTKNYDKLKGFNKEELKPLFDDLAKEIEALRTGGISLKPSETKVNDNIQPLTFPPINIEISVKDLDKLPGLFGSQIIEPLEQQIRAMRDRLSKTESTVGINPQPSSL